MSGINLAHYKNTFQLSGQLLQNIHLLKNFTVGRIFHANLGAEIYFIHEALKLFIFRRIPRDVSENRAMMRQILQRANLDLPKTTFPWNKKQSNIIT